MTNHKIMKGEILVILPKLAKEIGLNESIALQELFKKLQLSGTELDGKRWVKHTYEEWQEVFPFWSISTIKRIFAVLQKKGIVLVSQYGKSSYDRTNWYSICENTLKGLLPDEEIDTIPMYLEEDVPEEVQSKFEMIKKRLKELKFFPLKNEQQKELIKVCLTFTVEQINCVLEETAAKCIYAWKYAYKVLMTSGSVQQKPRRIIRTELVPDWLGDHQETVMVPTETDEDYAERKRRLEAIQMKYKKKHPMPASVF